MEIRRTCASAVYRFQKDYYSVSKEVLYNILIDFAVRMKLVKVIKYVGLKRIAESG